MAVNRDATSPNNRITYRIDRGSKDNFQIAQTGTISVTAGANLDRDLYGSTYSLTVVAVDGGLPALTATVVVTVTVLDVDSKPPTFFVVVGGDAEFSAVVREDAGVDSIVRRCVAADPDQNALLRYQIGSGSIAGFDPFGIPVSDVGYLTVRFVSANGP